MSEVNRSLFFPEAIKVPREAPPGPTLSLDLFTEIQGDAHFLMMIVLSGTILGHAYQVVFALIRFTSGENDGLSSIISALQSHEL